VVAALVLLAGIAVVRWDAVGCRLPLIECAGPEFFVRNDRATAVSVRIVSRFGETSVPVPAGTIGAVGDVAACDASLLVATTADGQEIGRLGRQDCRTVTWVLDPDGGTRVEPGRAALGFSGPRRAEGGRRAGRSVDATHRFLTTG
jgi:hypothetical protein